MDKTEIGSCTIAEYVYDPFIGDIDYGIEVGTLFDDLPDYWICPGYGLGKDIFIPFAKMPSLTQWITKYHNFTIAWL